MPTMSERVIVELAEFDSGGVDADDTKARGLVARLPNQETIEAGAQVLGALKRGKELEAMRQAYVDGGEDEPDLARAEGEDYFSPADGDQPPADGDQPPASDE